MVLTTARPEVEPAVEPHCAAGPVRRGRGRSTVVTLVLLSVLLGIAWVTLGPPGPIAVVRRSVVDLVQASFGDVSRSTVEEVANAVLFAPLGGALVAVLPQGHRWTAVVLGCGGSVLVELAQATLPGRVPDPVDVVANTVGVVAGAGLVAVVTRLLRTTSHRVVVDPAR